MGKLSKNHHRMPLARRISFIFVLMGGVVYSQYLLGALLKDKPRPLPLVIPGAVIRAGDLGLHTMTAGLLWVAAIQRLSPIGLDRLEDYIGQINDLDPRFSYPYAFGMLLLGGREKADAAIAIGKRGIKEAPEDWRIPYYLALTYHIHKQDRGHAIEYFLVAANTPGAPENVKTVAATYGNRTTQREETKLIWKTLAENSRDEVARDQAYAYLTHLEMLDLLDKAAIQYQKRYGALPGKIEDLVTKRILIAIPISPFGLQYGLDSNGRAYAAKPAK